MRRIVTVLVAALGLPAAGCVSVCVVEEQPVRPAAVQDTADWQAAEAGVHGVGGAWGALATGLFVWSAGAAGPDVSWTAQVPKQLVSILFTAVFCPVLTIAILLVLRALFGSLRVTEENEHLGLDITEHSEGGYSLEIS